MLLTKKTKRLLDHVKDYIIMINVIIFNNDKRERLQVNLGGIIWRDLGTIG